MFTKLWRKVHKVLGIIKGEGVKKNVSGIGNEIYIGENFVCGTFEINVFGNNNVVTIGDNCVFNKYNRIFVGGSNNKIFIGNNVTFDQNVVIAVADGTSLVVGDDCMFANNVRIRTSDQHSIYDANGELINSPADVQIGKHVWLGNSAVVMKGVTIGDGCVVGMESMVTKNIKDACLVVGTPAYIIKEDITWKR